jgi:hypothetical protein
MTKLVNGVHDIGSRQPEHIDILIMWTIATPSFPELRLVIKALIGQSSGSDS